jgi:hypothetical protein
MEPGGDNRTGVTDSQNSQFENLYGSQIVERRAAEHFENGDYEAIIVKRNAGAACAAAFRTI